jgi:hypothetical protein
LPFGTLRIPSTSHHRTNPHSFIHTAALYRE